MKCKLCQINDTEEDSHIIPAFAFRAMKKQSPTSFFRRPTEPNRRIQDGVKTHLLCPSCEDLFNKWETPFSTQVFQPVYAKKNSAHRFQYEEWLLRFAVSVSWRTLSFLVIQDPTKELHKNATRALETWRKFLLGENANIGPFSQHMLILDEIVNPESDPMINEQNTYIKAAICFDTVHDNEDAYIFSKICNIIIAGTIYEQNPVWEGTEIQETGAYGPGEFTVPGHFSTYLNAGVEMMLKGRSEISEKQSTIIGKSMKK